MRWILVLALVSAACDGPAEPSDAGDRMDAGFDAAIPDAGDGCGPWASEEEVAALETTLLGGWCNQLATCFFSLPYVYASIEECVRHDLWARRFVEDLYAELFRALRAGLLVLDPDAVTACYLELTRPCSTEPRARTWLSTDDDPCQHMFRRRCPAEVGDFCWTDGECGEGGYCQRDFEATCARGTCEPLRELGEACVIFSCRAPEGLTVACLPESSASDTRVCRHAILGDPVAEGELCDALDLDSDPVVLVTCPPDLYCGGELPIGTGDIRCRALGPRPGEGEACSRSCESGFFCNDSMICERTEVRTAVPVGASCVTDGVCDDQIGTGCVDGICVEAGGGVATPCDGWYVDGELVGRCTAPAFCDPDTQLCAAPRPIGEPCEADDHCETGCCEREPLECRTPDVCDLGPPEWPCRS